MNFARPRKRFPRILATSVAAMLGIASVSWGASATWQDAGSDWTTNTNWSAAYPNDQSDVATFGPAAVYLAPTITSATITVGEVSFTAGAPVYSITLNASGANTQLSFLKAGVTNNSGLTQNFVGSGNTAGNTFATFFFGGSATAGTNTTWTLNDGANLSFTETSTAGGAIVTIQSGGKVVFAGSSDGGTAAFTNSTGGFFDISGRSGEVKVGSIAGGGTFFLGASTLVTGGDNTNTTVSGVLSDAGGGKLTKVGTGTLTLTGVNTYTGATTVKGGILELDTVTNSSILSVSSTLVMSGGTLRLTGSAGNTITQIVNGMTVTGGTSVIHINNVGTSTTLDLRGSGTQQITHGGGGTVDFQATGGTLGGTAVIKTNQTNDATGILGAWATVNNGAGFAAVDGTGNIVAYNGYFEIDALGPNTIPNDPLKNVRISSMGTSGPVAIAAPVTTINTLTQNFSTASTIDTSPGTLRLGATGGIFITNGSAALTIGTAPNSGTVTAGGADNTAGELTVGNFSTNTLTINAAITNNGSGAVSLTKTGSGDLVLTGTNTYSGATTIGDGRLVLTGAGSLLSSTSVSLPGADAVFDLSGITASGQTIGTLSGVDGSSVVLGSKNLTVTTPSATSNEFAGVISGAGGTLTKAGAGTLVLSGNNTYSGGTTFSEGTLIVTSNTALGTGTLTIAPTGGQVLLRSSKQGTALANTISVLGDFYVTSDAGDLYLNGNVNLNGGTRVITGVNNADQIRFVGGISNGAGTGAVTFTTTLTPGQATYVSFIFDPTNVNTYTGLTTVDNGAFLVLLGTTANGAIQGNVLIKGNGVLDYLGGNSEQIADNAVVTVNSQGSTIYVGGGLVQYTGLDLFNAGGTETIGTLNGSGTVGLANSTLSVADGNFSGVISDGFHGVGYTGGKLTKRGAGTLTLSGVNTYTGATTIAGGTLALIGNGSLSEKTALNLTDASSVFNISGMLSTGDTVASLAGVAGSSVVLGSKNLTAGGNDTSTLFAGAMSGTGGSFTKMGTGTMTLSGANTYTGATTVNGGSLVLDTATNPVVLSSSSTLIMGGGSLELRGTAGASRTQIMNGLTITAGNNAIVINNNSGTATTLDLRGTSGTSGILRYAGGTIDFRAATAAEFGTIARVLTAEKNDATGMLGTWATVNNGTGFAMVNSDGVIVAYNGYTDINALGPNMIMDGPNTNVRINALGTAGPVAIASPVTNINTLTQNFTTASTIDTSPGMLRLGVEGGIVINSGKAALTIGTAVDAGKITAGGAADNVAGLLTLGNFSSSTLLINSTITDNGTGEVIVAKTGSGKVELAGTNTYKGMTIIGDGTLALVGIGSLLDTGTVFITGGTGVFDISGISGTSETIGSLSGVLNSSLVLGAKNLTVGMDDSKTEFAGVISGTGGSLTKINGGTLVLSGNNTYSGGTNLQDGALVANSNTALGSGPLTITKAGDETTLGSNVQDTKLTNTVVVKADFSVGTTASDFSLNGTVNLDSGTRTITGFNSKNQIHFGNVISNGGLTFTTKGLTADGEYVAFIFDGSGSNTYSGTTTIDGRAFLVLQGSATNGAIQGNVVIQGNGVLDYLGGASEQIADGATVTVNSQGNSANGIQFTGLDLYNAGGTESIGNLNGNGSVGLSNATLSVTGGSFSGVISDGFHGTTGGKLTKRDSGTLTLSGVNSYTGATTISGGTLALTGLGSLSEKTTVTLSAATSVFDISGRIVSSQIFPDQTIAALSGVADSKVILGANQLIAGGNNSNTTFAGVLSGTGGFTKTGTGTMTLTGANTYTGATGVTGGGVLVIDTVSNATVLNSASKLVVGGGTLRLTGASGTSRTQILSGLTVNTGASVIEINNNSGTGTTLDFRGPSGSGFSHNGGGTVDFRAAAGSVLNTNAFILASTSVVDATGIIGAWATVNNGEAFATVDSGTNRIVAYTGYTDIAARGPGSVIVNGATTNVRINSAGTAGPITLGSPVTNINTLTQNNGTAATVDLPNETLRFGQAGGIFITTSGASLTVGSTPNSGTVTAGGATDNTAGDLILANFSTTGGTILTVNSVIADNGTGVVRVTKTGGGVVNLAGANTYTGPTVIGDGTLALVGTGSLTDLNVVSLTSATSKFDISAINASGQTIGSISGVNGSEMLLGAKNLTTGGDNTDTIFAGVISGAGGSLTKVGTGVMTLSGTGKNTYTGLTTVSAGELILDKTGVNAISGDLLIDGGSVTLRQSNQIDDNRTLTVDGGGIFRMGVNSDLVAGVKLIDGFILGSGGTLYSTTTFDVRSGTITANLSSVDGTPVGLTKTTDGTVILQGSNAYEGPTNVNGGKLILDGTINEGKNGVTVANGSEFDVTVNGSVAVNSGVDVVTAINGNKVNNAGILRGGDNSIGIKAGNSNTITNSGAIVGGAVGFQGAAFNGYGNQMVNTGYIQGDKGLVTTNAVGGNTFANLGTLIGNSGIAVDGTASTGSLSFINGGLVSGDIRFGSGNDTMSLVTKSTTLGVIDGGAGANLLRLIGTETDTLDLSSGKVINFQSLYKGGGGTWTLTGLGRFINGTTVAAGQLYVQGNLISDVTVEQFGFLGGRGVITGNLINFGTLSPGNSPGTMTVTGNYDQRGSGTLVIEIAGKSAGQHDLLVVGGRAQLSGNLRIEGVSRPPRLKLGDKIVFLTADGGVDGKFKKVSNTLELDQVIETKVVYESNAVALEAVQGSFVEFAERLGMTRNQRNAARAIDGAIEDGKNKKAVAYLNSLSLQKVPAELDRVAPEEMTAVYRLGVGLANVQTQNIQRRTEDLRLTNRRVTTSFQTTGQGPGYNGQMGSGGDTGAQGEYGKSVNPPRPSDYKWGAFLTGMGDWIRIGDTENARGYDLNTAGTTVGVDYRVTPEFAIGASAGYTNTTAKLTEGGRLRVNGGRVGAYATYFDGGFHADASMSGGYSEYDTQRAGLQGMARGKTTGAEFNAAVGAGYDWSLEALTLGALTSVEYTYLGLDDFSEDGSLAPLHFPNQYAQSVRSKLGFKATYDWQVGKFLLRPEFRAVWQHEYGDRSFGIDSSLASGGGPTFTAYDPAVGRDSLLLGVGTSMLWSPRTSSYIYYDGELYRKESETHNISGGLRISF